VDFSIVVHGIMLSYRSSLGSISVQQVMRLKPLIEGITIQLESPVRYDKLTLIDMAGQSNQTARNQ
jgi:hypothetical protein